MRPFRHLLLSVGAALLLGALEPACSPGAKTDPGNDAYFRIPGAQFYRGAMPAAAPTAPGVASIVLVNSYIYADDVGFPIAGALKPGATAAAIGLDRDTGYWIVPAGYPSVSTPTDPSYAATASFSHRIVPGQYTLVVRAVDAAGRFGAPSTQILTAYAAPSTVYAASGDLVFTLTWDTESDLDLHVVAPSGDEIFHGAMSDQPPPFADPVDGGSYGYLDWDSNAACVIDGKRQEDVIWPTPPPAGTFTVRVDAASLCAASSARWTLRALLSGKQIGEAQGLALDADTRGAHDHGAGVTALTLVIP